MSEVGKIKQQENAPWKFYAQGQLFFFLEFEQIGKFLGTQPFYNAALHLRWFVR